MQARARSTHADVARVKGRGTTTGEGTCVSPLPVGASEAGASGLVCEWWVRSDCAGSRGGCSGLTADTHTRQNGHTRGRENGRSRSQDARQGTRRIVGARSFHCSHKREQSCVLVQQPPRARRAHARKVSRLTTATSRWRAVGHVRRETGVMEAPSTETVRSGSRAVRRGATTDGTLAQTQSLYSLSGLLQLYFTASFSRDCGLQIWETFTAGANTRERVQTDACSKKKQGVG